MPRWLPLLVVAGRTFSSPHYLTDHDLDKVREWMPVYRWAATTTGVPVMALPALQYRESDLWETWVKQPEERVTMYRRRGIPYRNMGGPFMLDQGWDGDSVRFDAAIRSYETTIAKWYGISPIPRVRDDFPFACLCAASELKEVTRGELWTRRGSVNRDVLAHGFWRYNGAYGGEKGWSKSAYVWNDPKRGRRFMVHLSGTDYLDARPGAIVIYDELMRRL